jgi:hypothetical protein
MAYKVVLTMPDGTVRHVALQEYTQMVGTERFKTKGRLVHVPDGDPKAKPKLTVIEGGEE